MENQELQVAENQVQTVQKEPITFESGVFGGSREFALAQRMAMALANSTVVPKDYQGNIANTLIAIEMANRLNTSPLMVMQHLYVVNGRPAWSSQYIIAMINSSRKYKMELQYDIRGTGDDMECTAWTEDYNGHRVVGPTITMRMAKEEGWVQKNGSKWKTMPEVMIRYRAASFFGRLNCPDMIMGIYSVEEAIELGEDEYREITPAERAAQEANQHAIDISEEPVAELTEERLQSLEPDF